MSPFSRSAQFSRFEEVPVSISLGTRHGTEALRPRRFCRSLTMPCTGRKPKGATAPSQREATRLLVRCHERRGLESPADVRVKMTVTCIRNKPWIEPEGDSDPSDEDPHLKVQNMAPNDAERCLFCPQCNTTLRIDEHLLMYCPECGWPSADTPTILVRPPHAFRRSADRRGINQIRKDAAPLIQLRIGPCFDDMALLEHVDPVCVQQGGKAMRHENESSPSTANSPPTGLTIPGCTCAAENAFTRWRNSKRRKNTAFQYALSPITHWDTSTSALH